MQLIALACERFIYQEAKDKINIKSQDCCQWENYPRYEFLSLSRNYSTLFKIFFNPTK